MLPLTHYDNVCIESQNDEVYSSALCKLTKAKIPYENRMKNSCDIVCHAASFERLVFLINVSSKMCTNIQQIDCHLQAIMLEAMMVNKYEHECPEPCTRISYSARLTTKDNHAEEVRNAVVLSLFLDSDDVTIHEEVLLFDFPTFVGSVGGSLGLFLGFSFSDFASYIIDKIFNTFFNV